MMVASGLNYFKKLSAVFLVIIRKVSTVFVIGNNDVAVTRYKSYRKIGGKKLFYVVYGMVAVVDEL